MFMKMCNFYKGESTIDISNIGDSCTGCTACKNVCKFNAISMIVSEDGFYYPSVDRDKCKNCGRCVEVCPERSIPTTEDFSIQSYALKHKSNDVRSKSTSGGLFTALSDYVLDNGGIIYGAAFKENFSVKHIRVTNSVEREFICGVKYVQSDLSDIFRYVKNDLINDKLVLFTGTPCQIAGLKNFLMKDYENLYLADLVCYGIPSPIIFADYIQFIRNYYKTDISKYLFRDKKKSWRYGKTKIILKNGTKILAEIQEIFDRLFWSRNILRRSCYSCGYANLNRISDITMGDCWGIEKINPQFDDDFGVSLCLVNSPKGKFLFNQIKKTTIVECIESREWIQPRLSSSTALPATREIFWQEYRCKGFDYIAHKYTNFNYWKIINRRVREVARCILCLVRNKNG